MKFLARLEKLCYNENNNFSLGGKWKSVILLKINCGGVFWRRLAFWFIISLDFINN